MKTRLAILLMLSLLAACGPSTSYRPTTPGMASLVSERGTLKYVRDGRSFDVSPEGVLGVVEGNVQAEAKARSFAARKKRGDRMMWFSLACGLAAAGYLSYELDRQDEPGSTSAGLWAAIGTGAGCLALQGAGLHQLQRGQLDALDAINIYNDDVAAGGEAIPDPVTQVTLPGARAR